MTASAAEVGGPSVGGLSASEFLVLFPRGASAAQDVGDTRDALHDPAENAARGEPAHAGIRVKGCLQRTASVQSHARQLGARTLCEPDWASNRSGERCYSGDCRLALVR